MLLVEWKKIHNMTYTSNLPGYLTDTPLKELIKMVELQLVKKTDYTKSYNVDNPGVFSDLIQLPEAQESH